MLSLTKTPAFRSQADSMEILILQQGQLKVKLASNEELLSSRSLMADCCDSDVKTQSFLSIRRMTTRRLTACIVFAASTDTATENEESNNLMARHIIFITSPLACLGTLNSDGSGVAKTSAKSTDDKPDCLESSISHLKSSCPFPAHSLDDNSGDCRSNCDGNLEMSNDRVQLAAQRTYHLDMDAQLAGFVSQTLATSDTFGAGFVRYAVATCNRRQNHDRVRTAGFTVVSKNIIVHLVYPSKLWLDYLWCERLKFLVAKKMQLEDSMNWLSTLGGAYSALGDYFLHFAEHAAKTSLKQLIVALELGSPPVVIRCHLYFALSLMQRGHLRRARTIITYQFQLAKQLPVVDTQVLAVCRGLWSRLRYMYQLRRRVRPANCTSVPAQTALDCQR